MVRDRSVLRRTVLMSVGTTASIVTAGCLGDDTSDDAPESGVDDESEGSPDSEESTDSGDGDDSAGGNELQLVVRGDDESIEGAVVTVGGEEAETGENGGVLFDGLEEGEYAVTVEADGFETVEEDLEVGERNLTIHSFELSSNAE